MKRHEAIKIVSKHIREEDLVVTTTGNISREVYAIMHSRKSFYMMGSMGLASSIGLGLALNLKGKRIIVIEGDGSILMNMGSIATIGHYAPRNLIHIVLDNESYESCGGQPSVSTTANLDRVAESCRYKVVKKIFSIHELEMIFDEINTQNVEGPIFILVKVEGGRIWERLERVPLEPSEITKYFREYLMENSRK